MTDEQILLVYIDGDWLFVGDSWFTEVLNSVHGNCFVFNSGWNDTGTLKSHRTGRRFGTSTNQTRLHCVTFKSTGK